MSSNKCAQIFFPGCSNIKYVNIIFFNFNNMCFKFITWNYRHCLDNIKNGMTFFPSYSTMKQITFPHPTKFSTTHNDLKLGSNIKVNILWTGHESKAFKNYRTGLINFITSFCVFIFKRWNSTSNLLNVLFSLTRGFVLASIGIITLLQ